MFEEPKITKTNSKLPKIIGLKESLEDAINNQDEQEKKEEVKCT